jgi:hypothetical protein
MGNGQARHYAATNPINFIISTVVIENNSTKNLFFINSFSDPSVLEEGYFKVSPGSKKRYFFYIVPSSSTNYQEYNIFVRDNTFTPVVNVNTQIKSSCTIVYDGTSYTVKDLPNKVFFLGSNSTGTVYLNSPDYDNYFISDDFPYSVQYDQSLTSSPEKIVIPTPVGSSPTKKGDNRSIILILIIAIIAILIFFSYKKNK